MCSGEGGVRGGAVMLWRSWVGGVMVELGGRSADSVYEAQPACRANDTLIMKTNAKQPPQSPGAPRKRSQRVYLVLCSMCMHGCLLVLYMIY